MVAAALLFSQGVEIGEAGASYVADRTIPTVHIANAVDTGVTLWVYTLLDSPAGSAIVPAVLQSGATPNLNFTWDAAGSYRIQLTVNGGVATDVRDIIVPTARRGWFRPGYLTTGTEANYPIPRLAGTPNARGWAAEQDAMLLDLEAHAFFLDDPMGAAIGQVATWSGTLWVPGSVAGVFPAPGSTISSATVLGATQLWALFTGGTYAIDTKNIAAGAPFYLTYVTGGGLLENTAVTIHDTSGSYGSVEYPANRSLPLLASQPLDVSWRTYVFCKDATNGVVRCIGFA